MQRARVVAPCDSPGLAPTEQFVEKPASERSPSVRPVNRSSTRDAARVLARPGRHPRPTAGWRLWTGLISVDIFVTDPMNVPTGTTRRSVGGHKARRKCVRTWWGITTDRLIFGSSWPSFWVTRYGCRGAE